MTFRDCLIEALTNERKFRRASWDTRRFIFWDGSAFMWSDGQRFTLIPESSGYFDWELVLEPKKHVAWAPLYISPEGLRSGPSCVSESEARACANAFEQSGRHKWRFVGVQKIEYTEFPDA